MHHSVAESGFGVEGHSIPVAGAQQTGSRRVSSLELYVEYLTTTTTIIMVYFNCVTVTNDYIGDRIQ